jgi:type II secretory pathway pseudopilin PulG
MKRGQALLEVIIATAIISIGLVAPLSLVVQSMSAGQQSKERTQATYLAQEAIELVQNVRDSNFKKEQNWLSGFNWSGNGYYAYNNGALTYLSEQKPENGEEIVLDGTLFYRHIKMTTLSDVNYITDCEVEINVEVIWPNQENPKDSVNLSSVITSWFSDEN